jgi:hypothetical protein
MAAFGESCRRDPMSPAKRLAQLCRLLCGQTTRGELGMHRQRNFLVMVTVAAAAATTPAWGQAVVPSAGAAGSGTLSAVSVPDFSGVWAHPSGQSGFEPLPSGPRPVTGRLRRNGVSDPYQYVGDYTNPILKPEASRRGSAVAGLQQFPSPARCTIARIRPAPRRRRSPTVTKLTSHLTFGGAAAAAPTTGLAKAR